MRVARATLVDFRNYERVAVELAPGLTIVHGQNGAGKTNLLEAVYFGCVGRSCRTANERELVRFGQPATRVSLVTANGAGSHEREVKLEPGRPKAFKLDGAPSDRATELVERPLVCVFMPDRLELVKGPAALRRGHLDELVAALWPARRATRVSYARALAQRNALLARVRHGSASHASLSGWGHELARYALALMADRAAALDLLERPFSERAQQLGLEGAAAIRYKPRSRAATLEELESELRAAIAQDLERGFTTHGPHRDDFSLDNGGRVLRRYGSQGQQRLALLALLLAERDVLSAARGEAPILLLDDVLSELDRCRRGNLLEIATGDGQALLTTADPDVALAAAAGAASIRVSAGRVDA